jgi:5-methylcytosine-specific restriction protein B
MTTNVENLYGLWDKFLEEWPLERLETCTLAEYSKAGDSNTLTAWLEQRLDTMGSIWGGSAFKFGIYSRNNLTPKDPVGGRIYGGEYAWLAKYGATPEEAFTKVKAMVVQVARASAEGRYSAIDAIDLGEAYKWKIAFHYQDRQAPGIPAIFKVKVLEGWLKSKGEEIPPKVSMVHQGVLAHRKGEDLLVFSKNIWGQMATAADPDPVLPEERDEEDEDQIVLPPGVLNAVLWGPPGTGKTYSTAALAVRLCDGKSPKDRKALMARYRELRNLQIYFVTFHPSFSYEEFVEGIRPEMDGEKVNYRVKPGVFLTAVTRARELMTPAKASSGFDVKDRKVHKMSLGDSTKAEEDWVYQDCLENDYVCLGFASGVDFTGCDTLATMQDRFIQKNPGAEPTDFAVTAVHRMKNEMKDGDLVVISDGNTKFRAIGVVSGGYVFQTRPGGYEHRRGVKWLWHSEASLPVEKIFAKRLSQQSVYLMDQKALKRQALHDLLNQKVEAGKPRNCVLIIDEINRANLAKTFGELITLLEPSKRLGGDDEQEAILPYSSDGLTVPPNLYVIGTMNTADRSIALMDTALRRRFAFIEMPPKPELLATDVAGVDLQALLRAMNDRIEVLFDRDHVIGHTYFLGVTSIEELVSRFQNQIIPLLQEYFYEDWRRIQQVFNDVGKSPDLQVIQDLESPTAFKNSKSSRFRVNPLIPPEAILKIYQ